MRPLARPCPTSSSRHRGPSASTRPVLGLPGPAGPLEVRVFIGRPGGVPRLNTGLLVAGPARQEPPPSNHSRAGAGRRWGRRTNEAGAGSPLQEPPLEPGLGEGAARSLPASLRTGSRSRKGRCRRAAPGAPEAASACGGRPRLPPNRSRGTTCSPPSASGPARPAIFGSGHAPISLARIQADRQLIGRALAPNLRGGASGLLPPSSRPRPI